MNNMKKIKVAFVLGALNRGGTESLILDVCRSCDSAPFDIVCLYRKEGNLSEEFHKTKVKMICLPCGNMLTYMLQLRQLFKNEKVDIVHSQTPSNTAVLGVALLGCNIKLLTSIHSLSFAHSNWFMRRWVYRVSQKIVFVSKSQMNYYRSQWNLKIDNKQNLVYNGIDTSKMIDMNYPMPNFLHEEQKPLIKLVVVGSFRTVRAQMFLLETINSIICELRLKNVKIYFIGGEAKGEEYLYKSCEQYIRDNNINDVAIMMGVRNDIYAILQHVDGFIYASNRDTFGIAVVEAMLCGVPVIVNDFEVMEEISQYGALATLYTSNNHNDCANKILNLIDNLNKYRESAELQVLNVKNTYSIKNHINNLYSLYQKL